MLQRLEGLLFHFSYLSLKILECSKKKSLSALWTLQKWMRSLNFLKSSVRLFACNRMQLGVGGAQINGEKQKVCWWGGLCWSYFRPISEGVAALLNNQNWQDGEFDRDQNTVPYLCTWLIGKQELDEVKLAECWVAFNIMLSTYLCWHSFWIIALEGVWLSLF